MPRIPSEEEWCRIEKDRLEEVWTEIDSADDPAALFNELEGIIRADLSVRCRIRIAEALAGYCNVIFWEVEMAEARRLVRGIRREIADLQKSLMKIEQHLAGTKEGSEEKIFEHASRECWAMYQNARQHQEQLAMLAGHLSGAPHASLAEPTNVVFEAMSKVAPPFRHADTRSALAILDALLERWTDATGTRKGQAYRSKVLSDLIERIEKVFAEATGGPPKAKDRFQSFIMRTLASLPRGVYNAVVVTDAAIPRRVQRLRSELPAGKRKRDLSSSI